MSLPVAILHILTTMSLLCNLSLAPIQPPYEPDEAEVVALAQTLYGECRGCSELQQKAVCWCVFNSVDDPKFPDTVIEVVSQPYQLQGYSPTNRVWDSLSAVATECLTDWHNGENRILDEDMCWFSGWNRINHFRNAWLFEEATKFWEEE